MDAWSVRTQPVDLVLEDLGGENWAKSLPPEPDRLVANFDPTLMEQVLDDAKRQRVANLQHHCQADDLRRRFEVSNGVGFGRTASQGD